MSETVLKEFLSDQKKMTRNATIVVLTIAALAHVIINAFAYVNNDPFLKIEAPILSGITLIAIMIATRIFKNH